jgi:hypothetical protein
MPQGGIGQESLKCFEMRLATTHKKKIETRIEQLSTSMDSWDMISSITPLTLGFHASYVSLLIYFEN